ncbi:MAG: aldo/keto reductase, partial [Myxococcota bacterium]|nr:aldo/keto reductase [Myxococcota bacterium]
SGHDDERALAALVRSWETGIRHWDTADVYGDGRSEVLMGRAMETVPRDDLFLATKVGWDPGSYDHVYHPALMRERLERSLTNMGTDRVDLYYLHHCRFGPEDRYLAAAIETARSFVQEGKVRYIGLSDWDSGQVMRCIEAVDPDVVQVYRTVLDDGFVTSGLRDHVVANDLGSVFFSTLRHGALLGKYDAPRTFAEGDFRNNVDVFRDPDALRHFARCRSAIGERMGEGTSSVIAALVGSLLQDTPGSCAIVGLRDPGQVDTAAEAQPKTSAEDAEWVRNLFSM